MRIIFIFLQTIKFLISEIRYNIKSNKYFSSIDFQNYLENNLEKWKNLDGKLDNKETIVVDCTNYHPMSIIHNLIIAKYLQKIYKKEIIIIDRLKNNRRIKLYKSFNFHNVIYIISFNSILNFFKDYKKFSDITKGIKNIKQFIDLKYKNIEIGRISYDDYLRNSFSGTSNKINFKLYFYLFKCISIYQTFKKNIQNLNVKYYVTHEIQFNPEAIIFQFFLSKNVNVFCKGIGQTKIGLRLFKKYSQRRYNRASLNKNTFFKILKSDKFYTFVNLGDEHIKNRFSNKRDINDIADLTFTFDPKKKIVEKKYFTSLFNWKAEIPIVFILAHNVFDGVFEKRMSMFQDNYVWLDETLKMLCKNKNINIIVKKHPTEHEESKIADVTEKIVKKYQINNYNINLFPDDIHPTSILNFAKCIFTEHGTAGLEYSCYGIPTVITGDAPYYRTGFTLEPKNIQEYENIINNIHKIQKLTDIQIKRAKLFAFYDINLSRVETKLNSYTDSTKLEKDNNYWENLSNNLKDFNFEECRFYKMLNIMIRNKNYNILNFDIF